MNVFGMEMWPDDVKRAALHMLINKAEVALAHCKSPKSARAVRRKLRKYRAALLVNVLSRES